MNWISVGVMRKNEMLIVAPGGERRELISEQRRHPRDLLAAEQHRALPDPLDAAGLIEVGRVLVDRERHHRVLLDVPRALGGGARPEVQRWAFVDIQERGGVRRAGRRRGRQRQRALLPDVIQDGPGSSCSVVLIRKSPYPRSRPRS